MCKWDSYPLLINPLIALSSGAYVGPFEGNQSEEEILKMKEESESQRIYLV